MHRRLWLSILVFQVFGLTCWFVELFNGVFRINVTNLLNLTKTSSTRFSVTITLATYLHFGSITTS